MPRYTGHRCIVPNCNSGYESTKSEKCHKFSVPFDEEDIQKWKKIIPRKNFELKGGMVVCEKHFLKDDIVWRREVKDPAGNVMASEELKKPHLKKGAVPSQFPNCPSYLSQSRKKRKSPKKREFTPKSTDHEKLNIKKRKVEESKENVFHEEIENMPLNGNNFESENSTKSQVDESSTTTDENETDSKFSERIDLFNSLFKNENKVNIPISWNRRRSEKDIQCIEYSECISRMREDKPQFFTAKQLVIYNDMQIVAKVSGINLPLEKLGLNTNYVSTITELEEIIKNFNKVKVCLGCASPNTIQNIENSFAVRDSAGYLRHTKCSLIITSKKRLSCETCSKAKKTLAKKFMRFKKINEQRRIVLKMSPTKKYKLNLIRSRLYKSNKNLGNYKSLCGHYKKELKENKKEMSLLRDKNLDSKMDDLKVNKNSRIVINEILSASKVKDAKGRRYTEDWIILCLLFHTKSPTTYNLLRDNKVLPLPATSTIRRYLSLIQTPCGFDDSFFKLLNERLSELPDEYKHGVLLVDEMGTRKNLRLDQKKMKILGLTDFGDEELNKSVKITDKADHGLVLMFHSLMESFSQPIAVFVSKGPVVGTILAKLIIQAICLLEQAGAKVHGVVSDSASANRKFWSIFGVSGDLKNVECSFAHPTIENRRIYVFADIVHLIKSMRNRLHDKKTLRVNLTDPEIDWEYFRKVFEVDKYHATGKWHPKLTAEHLDPNNMTKMRVILAVQMFSKTIAESLLKGASVYPDMFKNCEATAEFCLKINNLFDILNITNPEKGLRIDSPNYEKLLQFLSWLNDWEQLVFDGKLRREECFTESSTTGLRISIHSTIGLSKDLLEKHGFPYVLTGRINQDPLEVCSD
ncbi:uncharacterized protein LOC122502731 isoform X1 [Leptopilina heterotoma]|uniref:uncharacterized protein LOC122502731 isoform X1 n=1 Tax=Leptopilina heterotoma TaxID=63436 RepID=UPI001CA922A1|nr:uncharacterized protein LOC122502731 isoform X1 [Leptopilina heterotoma]